MPGKCCIVEGLMDTVVSYLKRALPTRIIRSKAAKSKKTRFALVGVVNTIVDFAVLNILRSVFGVSLLPANIVSTTAAMLTSFSLNKKAVFRGSDDGSHRQQFVQFIAVTLASIWFVQGGVIVLMHGLLSQVLPGDFNQVWIIDNVAKIIGIAAGFVWNYMWYSRVVFKKNGKAKDLWREAKAKARRVLKFLERHWYIYLTLAAAISFTLALVVSVGQSVWFDEGYSLMLIERPVSEIISLTSVDAHPPLYYLMLKLWVSLFGTNELMIRASSALCGAASIVVMALLLRDLFSKRIALIALPFITFAPFMLRYDYEIRMYALVMLIGVVSTWLLVKAWRTKQRLWWLLYGVLVVAGMYTLYMSAVFWLAHLAWLLYMTHQLPSKHAVLKYIYQPYWIVYAVSVLLFLPWIPTVLTQLNDSALPPYMSSITMYELTNILGLLTAYSAGWQIGPWLTVLLVVFIGLFGYVYGQVWQRIGKTQKQGLALLTLCFVVGIIFYTIISLPPNPPRFLERYVVHISVFWYALLGVVIALGWHVRLKLSALLFTVVSIVLLGYGSLTVAAVGNYNFQRLQDLQANTIRKELGCDNTTFVTSGPFGYIDMKYDLKGCDLKFYYPWPETFVGGFAPVNGSQDMILDSTSISTKRLVFVYYEDSTVSLTPDERFREVERRVFDKTFVIIYEQ